jgi:hypothetical protein
MPFSPGRFLSSGLFSPNLTVNGPIEALLNAKDRKERDKLTEKWRDHKLAELNFVGIVVCSFHPFHISLSRCSL